MFHINIKVFNTPGIGIANNSPILLFDSVDEKIAFLESLESNPCVMQEVKPYFKIDWISCRQDISDEILQPIINKTKYRSIANKLFAAGEFGTFYAPFAIKDNITQLQECREINNNTTSNILFTDIIHRLYDPVQVYK
jgi:hypothetical protein